VLSLRDSTWKHIVREQPFVAAPFTMSSLPPAMNFPAMEDEICKDWKENDTFQTQNRLAKERNDPVRLAKDTPTV